MRQTALSSWCHSCQKQPWRDRAGPAPPPPPPRWAKQSGPFSVYLKARGRNSRATDVIGLLPVHLTAAQWYAEGLRHKDAEKQEFVHENKIDHLHQGTRLKYHQHYHHHHHHRRHHHHLHRHHYHHHHHHHLPQQPHHHHHHRTPPPTTTTTTTTTLCRRLRSFLPRSWR